MSVDKNKVKKTVTQSPQNSQWLKLLGGAVVIGGIGYFVYQQMSKEGSTTVEDRNKKIEMKDEIDSNEEIENKEESEKVDFVDKAIDSEMTNGMDNGMDNGIDNEIDKSMDCKMESGNEIVNESNERLNGSLNDGLNDELNESGNVGTNDGPSDATMDATMDSTMEVTDGETKVERNDQSDIDTNIESNIESNIDGNNEINVESNEFDKLKEEELSHKDAFYKDCQRYSKIKNEIEQLNGYKYKNGELKVIVHRGSNLPKLDAGGKEASDPFVKVTVPHNKVHKTKHIDNATDPVWNESFTCHINDTLKDDITFDVFDKDKLTANDLIGSYSMPVIHVCQNNGALIDKVIQLQNPKLKQDAGRIQVSLFYSEHQNKH